MPSILKTEGIFLNYCISSDSAGIRTQDPIIKSDVLYRLSYEIKLAFAKSDLVDLIWDCKSNSPILNAKI